MTEATTNPFSAPLSDTNVSTTMAWPLALREQRLLATLYDTALAMVCLATMGLAYYLKIDMITVGIVSILLLVASQSFLLSTQGQTWGKRWAGMKIVMMDDNSEAGFINAFLLRSALMWLLRLIPGLGLLDVLFIFGRDRRCLHDLIAGTKVVSITGGPGWK